MDLPRYCFVQQLLRTRFDLHVLYCYFWRRYNHGVEIKIRYQNRKQFHWVCSCTRSNSVVLLSVILQKENSVHWWSFFNGSTSFDVRILYSYNEARSLPFMHMYLHYYFPDEYWLDVFHLCFGSCFIRFSNGSLHFHDLILHDTSEYDNSMATQ